MKRPFTEADYRGRRVLLRVDYNVPLENGEISDDSRITQSLTTVNALLDGGAALVLCSHLGRPGGTRSVDLSLAPVARRLSQLLDMPVPLMDDPVGPSVTAATRRLEPGAAMLLENLRFDAGEEANDSEFARNLADLGDIYVDDAFGAVHRAHASTVGVAQMLPAYAGHLLLTEVAQLQRALDGDPPRLAIIGGAKVSGKLELLHALSNRFDMLLIGGGMANTFLAAQGHDVGGSRTEPDLFRDALDVMRGAPGVGCDILLPRDFVIADRFAADAERRIATLGDEIPDGWLLLDIGPATVAAYREVIGRAGTVFWNGPMGVFELEPFARGTADTAHAVAASRAFRVVGGGDSVAAVRRLGLTGRFDHVSTGGGASLEFIEGRDLPGLSVIPDASPVGAATD